MLDRPTPSAPQPRRSLSPCASRTWFTRSLLCEHVLQDGLVEAQISHALLELPLLLLRRLQPSQLARAQSAVELLPALERLLGDADPAQDLRDRRPGLGLLQRRGDLLRGEPARLHGSAPPVRGSQNRKTRTHAGPKRWGDVKSHPVGHPAVCQTPSGPLGARIAPWPDAQSELPAYKGSTIWDVVELRKREWNRLMAVNSPELKAFLVDTPFFGGLSDTSLDLLISMLVERHFEAGATIIVEGEPGHSMYIVHSGEIMVTKIGGSGCVVDICHLGPGDFFWRDDRH